MRHSGQPERHFHPAERPHEHQLVKVAEVTDPEGTPVTYFFEREFPSEAAAPAAARDVIPWFAGVLDASP